MPRLPSLGDEKFWASVILGGTTALLSQVLPSNALSQLFQVLALALASLLAIIVSVGLLSVQIAANQFTPHIGRRFEERQFLTRTILLFGLAIASSLLSMLLVPLWKQGATVPSTIGVLVLSAGAVSFGAYSFLSLIDVKDDMLSYLNPEAVLDDLLDDVSFEAYQKFSEKFQDIGHTARSPVLEIFQIGQRAFEGNDNHTAINAIETLNQASQKIASEYGKLPEEERRDVTFQKRDLFDYWERLIDSAVSKGTDRTLYQIVLSLKEIAVLATEHGLTSIGTEAASTLKYLCEQTYEEDRLEKSYYARFNHVLDASLENGTPTIANQTVIYMGLFATRLANDIDPDEEFSWEESVVETLFGYFRDTWVKLFKTKSGQVESGEYRELHERFEREFGDYLTKHVTSDRSYPLNLASDLSEAGVAAAEHDEQWAVSRISRLFIEFWVIAEIGDWRVLNGLARIIDAGGREGVEDAFTQIEKYEFVSNEDIPIRRVGEAEQERNSEEQKVQLYENITRGLPRLNSIEGFRDEVKQFREEVEDRYQEVFEEA